MTWKPAWLDRITKKPTASFTAHFFAALWVSSYGPKVGLWSTAGAYYSTWWAEILRHSLLWALIAVALGWAWEVLYWHLRRRSLGPTMKFPSSTWGWPEVAPDVLVQCWIEGRQEVGEGQIPGKGWVRLGDWCRECGAAALGERVSMTDLKVQLYRHPAFDRRRASYKDMIPFVLGALTGIPL